MFSKTRQILIIWKEPDNKKLENNVVFVDFIRKRSHGCLRIDKTIFT